MLYEMVVGSHPMTSGSVCELLAIGDAEAPMPNLLDRRPGVGALGAIIDRCLQKQRDQRYRSAEELLAALVSLVRSGRAYAAFRSTRVRAIPCCDAVRSRP